VDADTGGNNAQNYRDQDENARVLAQFRRNEIDVIINIRMLTEGTDVPDVQTVFLTRQTTSAILLTQMVGRALRGPKFGGTKEAYIVPFIDDWRQIINWASFDLVDGGTETGSQKKAGQQALQMISVNRVI
jgi:superfamily II DNA or RNA helicase